MMPYRKGRTLRDLIAPDTRRRNAALFVLGGMIAGSLLTLGARAMPTECPFAEKETVPFATARDGVTPVEPLTVTSVDRDYVEARAMLRQLRAAPCTSDNPYQCF